MESGAPCSDMDDVRLERRASIHWELWNITRRLGELDASIEAARQLSNMATSSEEYAARRAGQLGLLLSTRFRLTAMISDLSEQIPLLEQATATLSTSDPQYPEFVAALARARSWRFARSRETTDIDAAVKEANHALRLARDGLVEDLDEYLLGAAAAHADRYDGLSVDEDLEKAAEFMREAMEIAERRGGSISPRAADLARILTMRYNRWGNVEDLDEASLLYRRAIDMLPEGDPDLASHKSGLGGAMLDRYAHYGDSDDLDAGVKLLAAAHELTDQRDSAKAIRGGRLANALIFRYRYSQADADISRAIELLAAIGTSEVNWPMKHAMLFAQADAFRSRGQVTRSMDDLDRSVSLLGELRDEAGPSGRRTESIAFATALVQFDRYGLSGELSDLQNAISEMRVAASDERPNSLLKARAEAILAQYLYLIADTDESARAECLRLSKASSLSELVEPTLSVISSSLWAELGPLPEQRTAFERALKLLPFVSNVGLTVADSIGRLRRVPEIASDACASFINAGQLEQAVEALEQGRATTLKLHVRRRIEVEALRAERADLADAYEHALFVSQTRTSALDVDPRGESRHIEALVEEIQTLHGFERFGLPSSFESICELAGSDAIVYLNVASSRCDALVVSDNGVALVPLDTDMTVVASRVQELLTCMETAGTTANLSATVRAEGKASTIAAWVWDAVIEPVMDALSIDEPSEERSSAEQPRIWWVPTGPLATIPIQIAGHHAAFGSDQALTARTLIDRTVSSQLPSAEMLTVARGVGDWEADDVTMLIVAVVAVDGQAELDGVREEARRLVDLVGREHVTLLSDATELVPDGPAVKSEVMNALPDAKWVHFACHASPSTDTPTNSHLVLSDYAVDPFRVEDLMQVRPSVPRVSFFSACSTAGMPADLTHEPVHFGTAAALVGYAHAVVTMWPIEDSPELAPAIYERILAAPHWPRDIATASAVQEANMALRSSSLNALHRWAATVHQGL